MQLIIIREIPVARTLVSEGLNWAETGIDIQTTTELDLVTNTSDPGREVVVVAIHDTITIDGIMHRSSHRSLHDSNVWRCKNSNRLVEEEWTTTSSNVTNRRKKFDLRIEKIDPLWTAEDTTHVAEIGSTNEIVIGGQDPNHYLTSDPMAHAITATSREYATSEIIETIEMIETERWAVAAVTSN